MTVGVEVTAAVSGRRARELQLRELVLLRRVRDRIDREYTRPLDVEALARGVYMSAGHLSRQFRLAYGEPPYSYLMTRRIERAMALLRRGDLSVTDVCFAVGCSSLGSFSSRFTDLVGMAPTAYRRAAARSTQGLPACVARQVSRPVRVPAGRSVRSRPPEVTDDPVRNGEAQVTEPQLA
ncbi:helix-turn-helix transcriptional regulator [Candidatus Frankia nodulisporulans]|uniref:helix-turn-helix transcriptional regulator n=1 Tax=Candidatus Frankia nodulisporulans TaxID=2060052 RepID=UPI001CDCD0C1|nr:helix-turn-helix transcriptional regulator [Candidatus Frankia nodulisporulans]